MKNPVEQFAGILLATLELVSSMEKTNISMLKLLEKATARNPKGVGIDAFLRMAEEVRGGWAALHRKGKAPTRKAREGDEKAQLVAVTKKKTLKRRKN